MQAINRKKRESLPSVLRTPALSDIVLILLCYFIISAEIGFRQRLKTNAPRISELSKIEHKSYNSTIWIGPRAWPFSEKGRVRMQVNDAFAEPKDIMQWARVYDEPWEIHQKRTVSLHVDKSVKMGIVTAVKNELRKANLRKVYYMANVRDGM